MLANSKKKIKVVVLRENGDEMPRKVTHVISEG